MTRPLSVDLRVRVVAAVEEDGLSYREAAARFRIGEASVSRFLGKARRSESLVPLVKPRHRPTLLDDADRATLAAMLEAMPDAILPELRDRMIELTGKQMSRATVGREVRKLGFTRKKSRSSPRSR